MAPVLLPAKMAPILSLLLVIPMCMAVPSGIVQPCNLDNYECIRENLAANSRCNPQVSGILPFEYLISIFPYETPFFNSSCIDRNLRIKNHNNAKVSQFFYNLDKDVAVLAIRCPMLEFQSTRTLIQHYPNSEDVEYTYEYKGTYPEIIVTVNIPKADRIDLCTTNAYPYVTALPIFNVDPKDRKTAQFLTTDQTYLNIYERETIQYRANQLIRYFVNKILCDFGCDY